MQKDKGHTSSIGRKFNQKSTLQAKMKVRKNGKHEFLFVAV
jgi:hypothetical protein